MKKLILSLITALCLPVAVLAQDFAGTWDGALQVGLTGLPLVLHLTQAEDGTVGASLDSPMQGAKNIACTATASGNNLQIDVPSIGASYSASLTADGKLEGEFTQMGQGFPLTLKRRPAAQALPYDSQEVTFGHGKVTLAGTLTLPRQPGPHRAVVLVSGSGAQDRDCEVMGHRLFAQLADSLTRAGIAVLRYDDRGVGGSSVATGYETTADFAQDAAAAIAHLRGLPQVDPARVGVIGHSEGGAIAIMLAGDKQSAARPDFIVTLAAPAVKGKDLLIRQNELMAETMGQEIPAEQRAMMQQLFTVIDTCRGTAAQLRAQLQPIFAQAGMPAEVADQQIKVMTSAWYRAFVQSDPTEQLKGVKCPMLAVNGEWDSQVDCEQNLGAIKKHVKRAQLRRYPNLNHLLQQCAARRSSMNYAMIDDGIHPAVIADIAQWIAALK